jgi:fructose-1,6-bisphosphatase II
MDDLVASEDVFFSATGITDGQLLDGVIYYSHGARTDSLVIRGKTGTVREMISRHNFDKLNPMSQIEY